MLLVKIFRGTCQNSDSLGLYAVFGDFRVLIGVVVFHQLFHGFYQFIVGDISVIFFFKMFAEAKELIIIDGVIES